MIEEQAQEEKQEEISFTEEVLVNPTYPKQLVTIGGNLLIEGSTQFKSILKRNQDVFAWEPSYMIGVLKRIIKHLLNVNPSVTPVSQKRIVLSPEKSQVVTKEVAEWLKASIVRPIGSSVFWMHTMDITMFQTTKEDEEKMTFYTDQGAFCYTKMPFRLKNTGATYQRLVDSVFQSQIGRNLEAYVDDMVVKSKTEREMIVDVAKIFDNLWSIPKHTHSIQEIATSQSKQNLQSSSMTFIHKTLIIPSVLDSCFISSTVSEVKRVMILLISRFVLMGQELLEYNEQYFGQWDDVPRVRNHHGGKCYSAYVRIIVADFSHAPPNEYSPSPDDKKQWSLNLLKIGMLVWGEADSETSTKRSLRRKLFKTCCMNWGEVNPTHAYYNGSRTSKDNEDPSWSTSFKTRRTQKTSSALEVLWKTLFLLYLYLLGTL
ncbi:hypothetical protein Tco_0773305 [Tanacetum coccineum]|uniref:Reverse transcriptase domain-containing protein n=1 Tax=Tanacetum coccineum TaxID=301880 RepID=A0ABQ4ZKD8_9ASTR